MLVISFCRKAKQILSTQVHRNLILSGEIKEEHKKQAVKHGAGRWGMSEVSCRQNWSACRVTKHLKCVFGGCVCVCCSEETTALSCPALSVLQDALHQQDSGGISYIRPSKLTFKEHGRRMTLQRCLFKVWKSSEHLGLCVWQCQSTGAPHLCF